MLPFEVLTLVFLFSAASATPQIQQRSDANSTLSSDPKSTTSTRNPVLVVHDETTATGWDTLPKPHTETPQSGWESSYSPSDSPIPSTAEAIHTEIRVSSWDVTYTSSSAVFTTPAAIHTEISVSITKLQPDPEPTYPGDGDYESSGGGGGVVQTSSEDLLGNIISRITETKGQPTASPTGNPDSPSSPTDNVNSPQDTGQPQLTENTLALPVVEVSTGAGLSITVGPAVLTLTPGLSTTLGDGFSATLVEVTTDSEGQTVVVVSSNGVATTATLSEGSATASTPRPASITTEATSGVTRGTSRNTPTSTRSTGDGVRQTGIAQFSWLAVLAGLGVMI